MTGRLELEGYPLQSDEVSSSTDRLFAAVFASRTPRCRLPPCRGSYRLLGRPAIHTVPRNEALAPVPAPRSAPAPSTSWQSIIRTRTAFVTLGFVFSASLFGLFLAYSSFPKLQPDEKQYIKIPWNINEAKDLGLVLDRYKEDHFYSVLFGVFLSYIFLQTFAIPGSLFLSILSGFLFNLYAALTLVCTCSALGASLCFLLSQLVGRRLVWRYFPARARDWARAVDRHRSNLFNYVVFLRATPFLPNWFINLTAPVVGVPLAPFALGTFVGVAPPSLVAIQAGRTLHRMSAAADAAPSWQALFWLGAFAVLSLVPIAFKRQLKRKFE